MSILRAEFIMQNDQAHRRLEHAGRYKEGSAFVGGEYCGLGEAYIPLTDPGFRYGDAAYDVVSVSKDYFFRLHDHLQRFEESCSKFRLACPYTAEETTDILTKLIRLAGVRDAYVFWCVTRGSLKKGEGTDLADADSYDNNFYAFVTPYGFIAGDELRTRGMDLLLSKNYVRIPSRAVDASAKNFHWMDMTLSNFEAGDAGKDRSILTDTEGYLTEAPGANVFLLKGGELYTPDTGCLEGITRKTTLELAEEQGIPTHVEKVHKDQLLEADEAFLTSSAGGIMPVNSVDDVVLGGKSGPGEITIQLHNLYWERRWQGWYGTPVGTRDAKN